MRYNGIYSLLYDQGSIACCMITWTTCDLEITIMCHMFQFVLETLFGAQRCFALTCVCREGLEIYVLIISQFQFIFRSDSIFPTIMSYAPIHPRVKTLNHVQTHNSITSIQMISLGGWFLFLLTVSVMGRLCKSTCGSQHKNRQWKYIYTSGSSKTAASVNSTFTLAVGT